MLRIIIIFRWGLDKTGLRTACHDVQLLSLAPGILVVGGDSNHGRMTRPLPGLSEAEGRGVEGNHRVVIYL